MIQDLTTDFQQTVDANQACETQTLRKIDQTQENLEKLRANWIEIF